MSAIACRYVRLNDLRGAPCSALAEGKFPLDAKWTRKAVSQLGWPTVLLNVRGGKALHVNLSVLPPETSNAISAVDLPAGDCTSPKANADFDRLIRLSASEHAETLAAHRRLEEFHAEFARSGERRKAAEIVAARHGIHHRTIYRDLERVEGHPATEWLPLLARKHGGGRPRADIHPDAWRYFLGFRAASSKLPWEAVYRKLQKAAAVKGWTIPSSKTLLRRVRSDVSLAALAQIDSGPKAVAALYPSQTRTVEGMAALDVVGALGIEGGREADFLHTIAQYPGGLRYVVKTVRQAALSAWEAGTQAIAVEHLATAWSQLSTEEGL